MDWGQLILFLFIIIFLVMFILRDDDEEDFIYTASIPIGLPIVQRYEGSDLQSVQQDAIGVTIKLSPKDTYTYSYKRTHNIENIHIETYDKVMLLDMVPFNRSVSGELYLSSTDRRYIRNNQSYLVGTVNGKEIRKPLIKTRIKEV